ncbi:hypothetical protein FFLO_01915 [Filobasidium floriforme]|uniref:ATP-dependent DNA helicase n=1 Tax=Filobasidium floriforme TaxID=5210 RepID=A0A8K0JQ61_9TREE|nr:ATP-dependent DNA helicase [Filobasidium floriforme]KAG7562648.1 hypothetical protein FFLO_01915 [Filobasidium floriforme]KAH8089455.1 ATP-dependent DNA helicase [Filobasidium floriforme]
MAPSSSPLPAVGARVHSSSPGNKLSDTESDGEDMVTPTRRKKDKGKSKVLGTPAVPLRYPNLETPTQVSRAISKPRSLRRNASNQEDCLRVLTTTFNKPSFRGRQKEIMEAAVHGADVLVVAPTGMGKSLCFQVPAVADAHGITIVISPLLSLMKNQVEALRGYGVKVHILSSETTFPERQEIEKDLASGHPYARLLYITPESLFSPKFLKSIKIVVGQKELRRLVVDEAHCISEWGSSFRPEYRKLGFFRKEFPDIPIMALTASATAAVERDIIAQLGLSPRHLYRCVEPFNRTNLYYEVRYRPEPDQYRIKDVEMFIKAFAKKAPVDPLDPEKRTPVSGIIYCRARAMCDQVAEMLREEGIRAKPFHRGLKNPELDKTMQQWLEGGVECVVATIAFGMGIDKPNVRYVVHFDLPKSFEGYYQETGRAGRDGHISRCLLYYSREDAVRLRRLVNMESGKKKHSKPEDDDELDEHSGVDSFKQVQHYAEATTLCRHVAICRYFGEKIDEANPVTAKNYCDNMCDVCVNPEKVATRAKQLTAEVAVSSQIPFRKGRDREELDPVHPVSFYGRRTSPSPPAAQDPPRVSATRHGIETHSTAMPPPSAPARPEPRTSVAAPVTNPYLAAPPPPGLSRVGIAHSSHGHGLQGPRRAAPDKSSKEKTSPVIIERSEPPTKKSRIVPPNPYAASPSSANPVYTVAARRIGSQHGFKTPFMTQPRITPSQRASRKLKENSSFDFDIEEGSLRVEMSMSQKLPTALRTETLKAIVKAMHNCLTGNVWERLFAAKGDFTAKQRTAAILSACKGTESDVMSWSVSAEGYSERTAKVLRSIKSQRAWQMVCSGDMMSSDEDDNEEAETLEQIRQRIVMALK